MAVGSGIFYSPFNNQSALPACVRVSDGPVGPVIANILPQPRYRVSNLLILPGHADYLLRKSYRPLVDVFNIIEKQCFGLR